MVRRASEADYELVLEMATKFANESPYSSIIDLNKMGELIKSILTNYSQNSVILIDEEGQGFIAGCLTPHIFLKGIVATELAWWVDPLCRNAGIGSELLHAFEDWAYSQGCSYVTMVSLSSDFAVGSFYEQNGYKLQEQAYFKSII